MAETTEAGLIALGGSALDLARGLLLREGAAVPLRPTPFRLLACLARNAGHVMGKDALLDQVWPGVTVTEDSLTQAIREIRAALGPQDQALLRTIPRRGYLLEVAPAPTAPAHAVPDPGAAAPTVLPRIAVLPFEDATGAPGLAARVAILNDEIASGLARFRTLTVLARQSCAAATADAGRDPAAIAARLRADYVLDGTAVSSADGFHVALRLCAGAGGALVWSETFDCAGTAILTLRDRAPARMVGHLFSMLEADATHRTASLPTGSLSAFDRYAQASALLQRADPALIGAARALLEAAVEADPGFGLAWSFLAWTEVAMHDYGMAPPDAKARAVELARRGATLAPTESRALSMLGFVQGLAEDYEAAERNSRTALALNPCSADIMRDFAALMIGRGRPEEALDWLGREAELTPISDGHHHVLAFEALFQLGRLAEASRAAASIPHPTPRHKVWRAAIAAELGAEAEVRRLLDEVARTHPDWDHLGSADRSYRYEDPACRERMLAAVGKALAIWRGAPA